MDNENYQLRKLLWLRHGCSVGILYGDDGEMQCSRCMIDFKRDSVEKIEQRFIETKPHPTEPGEHRVGFDEIDEDGKVIRQEGATALDKT